MKIMKKWIVSLLIFLLPLFSYALVDYSEDSVSYSTAAPKREAPPKRRVKKTRSMRRIKQASASRFRPSGNIQFAISHAALTVSPEQQEEGKLNITNFHTHIQTPYNIFLDANYWIASSGDYKFVSTAQSQSGNVDVRLGFNWLEFGSDYDRGTIDFYFGSKFRGDASELATSRTDKIVGIETAKRFLSAAIGFGYEYSAHGAPKNSEELTLDATHKLSAAISWQATGDIRFLVEANFYKTKYDKHTIQYSAITPKLDLRLAPLLGLQLGGVFQMKEAQWSKEDAYQARLWDIPGLYGNSIFAALKLFL